MNKSKILKLIYVIFGVVVLCVAINIITDEIYKKSESCRVSSKKNIVVYFPNWGVYAKEHQRMTVGQMPWGKVTHINHAFFTINQFCELEAIDTYVDFESNYGHQDTWNVPLDKRLGGHFAEYRYYKKKYPNVKVLVSVGGWTRGENFHIMAKTEKNRTKFINSVIKFLKKYPFIDGIDIDWEYPGINRAADTSDQDDRGCPGGEEDKKNYTLLLKELRAGFNKHGFKNKLLTIATPANPEIIKVGHEPEKYAQYITFMNVMTYDMHSGWEKQTNHHAAIYPSPKDPSPYKNVYTAQAAAKYYKKAGVPASKINIGSPFYSRGWAGVQNGLRGTGLFAKASGENQSGVIPWFELKKLENAKGWNKYFDKKAGVPYLYNYSKKELLSYEDERSLAIRCNFVKKNKYGGIIVWEITGDDKSQDFPMTTLLYNELAQ